MVINNNLTDYLLNRVSAAGEGKKLQGAMKTTLPDFKDALSQASSKGDSSKEVKTPQESDRFENRKKDVFTQGKPVRTYRQVVDQKAEANEECSTAGDQNKVEQSKTGDKPADSKKAARTKAEAAIECLAQLLGVSPSDLAKLLEQLNIKPEDLGEASTAQEAAARLGSLLGLKSEEQKVLQDLLAKMSEMLNQAKTAGQSEENTAAGEAITLGEADGTEDNGAGNQPQIDVKKTQDFSQVMAQLKLKLNQLAQKYQENPQKTDAELAEQMQAIFADTSSHTKQTVQTGTVNTGNTVNESGVQEAVDKSAEGKSDRGDASGEQTDSKQETATGTTTGTLSAGQKSNTEHTTQQPFAAAFNNQIHKAEDMVRIVTQQKEVLIPKSEIINQVVDKAKVVISSDKSEMIMDLNPESLGKLSLKVVTERGMVVAKFIAENQQVREVLEANMQLLKDSLQKQGMVVQDCSVSVGQESFRGFSREAQTGRSAKGAVSKAGAVAGGTVSVAEVPEERQGTNPYEWNESNINLTA